MVVVIDDDEAVLESTCFLLAASNIQAVGYSSAEAFLKSGPDGSVHCVLVDHNMPGISGLELIEKLALGAKRLRTILMSGQLDERTRQRALQLGAAAVLAKPVSKDALLDAIGIMASSSGEKPSH